MPIPVIHVASTPPLSMLSGFHSLEDMDRREELHAYIRDSFERRVGGPSTYFGSAGDRYAGVFENTMRQHTYRLSRAANQLRDARAMFTDENIIRPCTTLKQLRKLPPVMYEPILSLPSLYRYFRRHRVQGWGNITPEEIEPKVKMWRRLIDFNGHLNMDPADKTKEQKFHYVYTTDDPYLTAQQIYDIRRTRQFVESVLAGSELDPTDLDEVRS